MSLSTSHCDSCGLAITPGGGMDCSRCGYPINDAKEEAFLHTSLYNLGRVAQYGGANITVTQLIDRYQRRLAFLSQRTTMLSSPAATAATVPVLPIQAQHVPDMQVPVEKKKDHQSFQSRSETSGMVVHNDAVLPGIQVSSPKRMFSVRAFFADQTINIVASLGAFLILIGSLSFIATTSNLLLAFIVLLIVHALFGSIGAITYRFTSLHTVSVIYTAIFTLQVPLVGFTAYRFGSGSAFQISTSLLIAAATGYAAGVYGVLAIYQKFRPFGYLAAVALFVMDLAIASTLNLAIWWWPSVLMILAFPLLIFVRRSGPAAIQVSPARSVLREPAQVLLGVCVTCSALCVIFIALCSLLFDGQLELRFSMVVLLLLLSGWLILFIWYTKRYEFMRIVPYLCVTSVLALVYALYTPRIGYVLTLTALAILFCAFARLDLRLFDEPENKLKWHLELLALILVGVMPFIAAPGLLTQIITQAYFWHSSLVWPLSFDMVIDVVVLLLGCLLTLSVLVRHTRWQKVLTREQAKWCWLLLLCGFLFNYVYALVIVVLDVAPVWAMLGFFLLSIALTVYARRFLSVSWANPLDVLSICVFVEILLLGLNLDPGNSIVLLLSLSGLFYVLALYQQRRSVFPLFLLCALMAWLHLFNDATTTLFILALLLPLVSAGVHRALLYRRTLTSPDMSQTQLQSSVFVWEWPLLLISIVYGISIVFHDSPDGAGTLHNGLALPIVAVLVVLALVWYAAGVLAQNKWWSGVAIGFALWGIVLVPQTVACQLYYVGTHSTECLRRGQLALYYLAGMALFSAVSGLCIDWLTKREIRSTPSGQIRWSWPWYVVSLGATGVLLLWSGNATATIPPGDVLMVLCTLVIVALAFMLVTRVPELLILVALLSVRAIASTPWLFWQQMSVCSVLCVLLFAAQFVWRFLTPHSRLFAPTRLSAVLALGGQLLVVLVIILAGGLFATAGVLAHVSAGSLAVLALLLLWWGALQTTYIVRWSFVYTAGLLCSLVVSWELSALGQTQLTTLWLAPAAYLIVIAPFLSRDERLPGHHRAGQLSSIVGAIFLLLPTLWLNLNQNDLQSALLLVGESMLLMLVMRVPELLVLVALFGGRTIMLAPWLFWQQMSVCSVLCVLLFAAQLVWRFLTPASRLWGPARVSAALALGGQLLVVLVIILAGGLFATAGVLAHVGAGSLAVLALLLLWWGALQTAYGMRWSFVYTAGLLCSLAVSWELSALGQTQLTTLWLAPAAYLIVIAPFLSRDERLPEHHRAGQLCSIAGAIFLLLPTLWLSFSQNDLQPSLLLIGESLLLLLLGLVTRVRFFVLSSVGLVIVTAIHVLFLPSLGIPTSLALSLMGVFLLVVATALLLVRSRLAILWTTLE